MVSRLPCLYNGNHSTGKVSILKRGPGFISSGVGVTEPISSIPLLSNFSTSLKYMSPIEYHIYIWQVSLQLSCGDTCQISMWCKESNRYFCMIENFAYGGINEGNFSNPHPRPPKVSEDVLLLDTEMGPRPFLVYQRNDNGSLGTATILLT